MSDVNETLQDKTPDKDENRITTDHLRPINSDHVLQALVDLTNNSNVEMFGITLQLGGFIVSGFIMPGRAFFAAMAEEMAAAYPNHPDTADTLRTYFTSFAAPYTEEAVAAEHPLPMFIHLRAAKFFHNSGQPMPANRPILWRGRISQVAGFCMGTFSA